MKRVGSEDGRGGVGVGMYAGGGEDVVGVNKDGKYGNELGGWGELGKPVDKKMSTHFLLMPVRPSMQDVGKGRSRSDRPAIAVGVALEVAGSKHATSAGKCAVTVWDTSSL